LGFVGPAGPPGPPGAGFILLSSGDTPFFVLQACMSFPCPPPSPISPFYVGLGGADGVEANVSVILPTRGHFKSFYCYQGAMTATGETYTLNVNDVSTALTCTVPSGSLSGSTTGASVSFSAGDVIDILLPATPPEAPGSFAIGVGP